MPCHRVPLVVLAALGLAACGDGADPVTPFAPQASVGSALHPPESIYRVESIPVGTPWGGGFSDALIEIDGHWYVPHLAVVETARENQRLTRLLSAGQSCWLGAHRASPGEAWAWVLPGGTWDTRTYTNWSKNVPRDRTDDEPNAVGTVLALMSDGRWRADVDGTGTCHIIELSLVEE